MQAQKESISYWEHLKSSEKEAIKCKKLVRSNILVSGGHEIECKHTDR